MAEQLRNHENTQEQQSSHELRERESQTAERLKEAAEAAPNTAELAPDARTAVEKHAVTSNEVAFNKAEQPSTAIPRDKDTKSDLYYQTLSSLQRSMKPVNKQFSRFIHSKPVEVTSEVLEKTVFRPSALLGGAIVGSSATFILYLVARRSGFELSGSEFFVFTLIGGFAGLMSEFIKKKVFRKK